MAKFDNEKAFTRAKFKESIKYIIMGAKKSPILFLMSTIFTILDATAASLFPKVAQNLIAKTTDTGGDYFFNIEMSWQAWAGMGIGILLLIAIFEYLVNYSTNLFSKRLEIFLRNKALESLVNQDMSYYFDNQIGLIMTRIIGDSAGVGAGFDEFYIGFIYLTVSIISTIAVMFSIDVHVATFAVVFFLVAVLLTWFFFIWYRRAIIISVDVKQKVDTDMTDRLINVRVVKANGTEEYEVERTKKLNKKYSKKLTKVVLFSSTMNIFNISLAMMMPPSLIVFTILFYGQDDVMSYIPTIIAMSSASYQLLGAIMFTPQILRGATKLSNCVMRLGYILDPIPLIDRNVNGEEVEHIKNVRFEDVEFAYPDQPENPILPKISIEFEKGKSYAFVGETGVGKSTIAKLLLRFYDPTNGKVLINGEDLSTIKLSSYLENVGYVEQEPQILFGTVMENIKYASFNKTDEEAIKAAKKAQLHEFILSLPDGYDTILGERGFMLSGGQKQRLVITRLFLKNPELLVLDEATSALDNIVEKEIQGELDKLMIGRTTVVIAHRLSTIKNVDYIVVLERGVGISQIGTYKELKTAPGRFKKLYEAGLMD